MKLSEASLGELVKVSFGGEKYQGEIVQIGECAILVELDDMNTRFWVLPWQAEAASEPAGSV